ncbi:putative capsular polysaccharide synthesis family protein [Salinibacillus xinjiangensis]|uniref:Sulfotransferase domain-containing protein n=1 Tax=Salinibacillus xinjiangensis TaxID=1229268 RepID=A0A6G1X2E6_9BACI|nr:putative capsular polysaccharide synthesis family protein [Salinibacillus xinjiangensis]MRG85070.1 hypothetical protein [Salinibacillus xinjiangensis]
MKEKTSKFFKFLQKDIVLIYQMGKVGSTSIEETLEKSPLYIEHAHSLRSPMTYEMFKRFSSTRYYLPLLSRLRQKINGVVKKVIFNNKKNIKIISLVREPISRNISMFFQDIHIPIFDMAKYYNGRKDGDVSLETLKDLYFSKLNHKYGVTWFENEFEKTFGINIYDYEFDKEKGFTTISQKGIDIMVIKMEKLGILEEEIGNFLEMKNFKLSKANISGRKWYSELYIKFKEEFSPSEEYVDSIYNNLYMEHFYTEEEIKKFKEKWLKAEKI